MFFPEKMVRVSIEIEPNYINSVLENIGRTALLHIDKEKHQAVNDTDFSRVKALLTLVQKYMHTLGISPTNNITSSMADQEKLISQIEDTIIIISKKTDTLSNKIKESAQELEHFKKADAVKKALSPLIDTEILSKNLKHLKMRIAILTMEATALFKLSIKPGELLFVHQTLFEKTNAVALFYQEESDSEVSNAFNTFKAVEISTKYFSDEALEKEKELQIKLHEEMKSLANEYAHQLQEIENHLNSMYELEAAKLSLRKEDNKIELTGWIPKESVETFVSSIKHAKVSISSVSGDAPVLLKTPPYLLAFEKLITGFSYPRYGEMNPVVPFAFSFLLLFGIMFGDVGHGLVLALIGLLVKKYNKEFTDLGQIYFLSGISSTFFGFIYSSLFGLHHVLPIALFTPMADTLTTILFSIGIGVFIISLSFFLHIVTAIKREETNLLFISEGSVLWLLVYWFSIGIMIKYFIQELNIVYESILLSGLLLTILILMVHKTKQKVQSFIDLIREYMDTLTNTISFLRVGAFALAHAALFIAVFSLARMVSEIHGESFFYWFTIVLGNIVIIVLEGIVVTIQTLRLEYFEFFKRFFKGGGLPYKPYTLGVNNEDK